MLSLSRQALGDEGTKRRLLSVAERLRAGIQGAESKGRYHGIKGGGGGRHLSPSATSVSHRDERGGEDTQFLMGEDHSLEGRSPSGG